jgi:hypothetical protein
MNAAAQFPWSAPSASANAKTTFRAGMVTTNRGLIHFDSEPGRGTRALILFPRALEPTDPNSCDTPIPSAGPLVQQQSVQQEFQEIKKESLL